MNSIKSKQLHVALSETQMDALDYIVKFETLQRPLFESNRSDVIRELIEAKFKTVKKLNCPQCGQITIPDEHRPGARWCGNCAEPVLWLGGKDNGA